MSLLGSAVAGPSNIIRVGEVRARESLHQAIRQACAAAKIDPQQLHRACVGVAGVASEEVANAVRKLVAEVISTEIQVVGDMQIALQAALGTEPGVPLSQAPDQLLSGAMPREKQPAQADGASLFPTKGRRIGLGVLPSLPCSAPRMNLEMIEWLVTSRHFSAR